MTVIEIQAIIDSILTSMVNNPASDVVEYSIGDKTVKKRRQELREELSFWREELARVGGRKRTVHTRF